MKLWLSSWKEEEIDLDVSVLEGSKCPVNIVTLQAETTIISTNSGHQSSSDKAPLPRRMENLKAPWNKPTTCTDSSLLQNTQLVMEQTSLLFSAKCGFFLRIKAAGSYSSPLTSVQGVTGGTDQTSGECSLGQTISI